MVQDKNDCRLVKRVIVEESQCDSDVLVRALVIFL